MIDKILLKSYDYIMNSDFNRIKIGKKTDINNKIYKIDYYNTLIDYFKKKEEYEKCEIINIEKNKRNNFLFNLNKIINNKKL